MACIAHAAQIDLRFGDAARELLGCLVGAGPGDFTRKRFRLLGQGWNGTNGKAERMAKRVSRCASAARVVCGPVLPTPVNLAQGGVAACLGDGG